jgi:hypothetical protein
MLFINKYLGQLIKSINTYLPQALNLFYYENYKPVIDWIIVNRIFWL